MPMKKFDNYQPFLTSTTNSRISMVIRIHSLRNVYNNPWSVIYRSEQVGAQWSLKQQHAIKLLSRISSAKRKVRSLMLAEDCSWATPQKQRHSTFRLQLHVQAKTLLNASRTYPAIGVTAVNTLCKRCYVRLTCFRIIKWCSNTERLRNYQQKNGLQHPPGR